MGSSLHSSTHVPLVPLASKTHQPAGSSVRRPKPQSFVAFAPHAHAHTGSSVTGPAAHCG